MFLAIDYGTRRIGLALGEILPKGAGFIDGEKPIQEIINEIIKICTENEVEKIIIGLPTTRSGTGKIEQKVKQLGNKLEKESGIKVIYEVENFTSTEAERILRESDVKNFRKEKIDELAAVLILEQYLNERRER